MDSKKFEKRVENLIAPRIDEISGMLEEFGKYGIFYTQAWDIEGEKKPNVLIIPKDTRFDRIEFVSMVVNMVCDYVKNAGKELKGSEEILLVKELLEMLYKEGSIKINIERK